MSEMLENRRKIKNSSEQKHDDRYGMPINDLAAQPSRRMAWNQRAR